MQATNLTSMTIIVIFLMHHKTFIGNHRIHEIVQQGFYELRIDMADFNSESRYAVYKRFYIGDETTGYQLHVEDYEGTAGRYLTFQLVQLSIKYPFIIAILVLVLIPCTKHSIYL